MLPPLLWISIAVDQTAGAEEEECGRDDYTDIH
jgi:hypothetical protein